MYSMATDSERDHRKKPSVERSALRVMRELRAPHGSPATTADRNARAQ